MAGVVLSSNLFLSYFVRYALDLSLGGLLVRPAHCCS